MPSLSCSFCWRCHGPVFWWSQSSFNWGGGCLPKHGPWRQAAPAHTFQESSLAGKDGTMFAFRIPGWGRALFFRERESLACLSSGIITPGCSIKQTRSPWLGVKAYERQSRRPVSLGFGAVSMFQPPGYKRYLGILRIAELLLTDRGTDLWIRWGMSSEEMNPQLVSVMFPGHLGTMQHCKLWKP